MFNRLVRIFPNKSVLFIASRTFNCSLRNAALVEHTDVENKYLLILDFEATCEDTHKFNQEIIEFPCLKVNLKNFREEARFHHYVKPVINPVLTAFCTKLTGIMQEVVDEAQEFPKIYYLFEKWREEQGLSEKNSIYVTSGDWDLGHMMPKQCQDCNLPVPLHMKQWIDIKKLFGYHNQVFYNAFTEIMEFYGLKFQGKAHSGIDDCLNILQAVRKMGESNIKFSPTSELTEVLSGFKVKMLNEVGRIQNSQKTKIRKM